MEAIKGLPWADLLLVSAIAVTAVWVMVESALISTARGTGRSITVGLGWWIPALILWQMWVIAR